MEKIFSKYFFVPYQNKKLVKKSKEPNEKHKENLAGVTIITGRKTKLKNNNKIPVPNKAKNIMILFSISILSIK